MHCPFCGIELHCLHTRSSNSCRTMKSNSNHWPSSYEQMSSKGDDVGFLVDEGVGAGVGHWVGLGEGEGVGEEVGDGVGDGVGSYVGIAVGLGVGHFVGDFEGDRVGFSVGDWVGGTQIPGSRQSSIISLNSSTVTPFLSFPGQTR